MTRSHAKNNTSGSVFTYAERHRLDYGTKKQRLGADSMKKLDSCSLCLAKAQSPVACGQGHLYCKECVLASLLSQKSQIRAQQAQLDAHAAAEQAEKDKARAQARERVLADFEKGISLAGRSGTSSSTKAAVGSTSNAHGSNQDRGTKRKFELDADAVEKLAKEAEEAALKDIEREQSEARRAKLPAYWLPTLTPQASIGPLKDIKLQTLCSAGERAHPLAMKSLLPVHFTYAGGKSSSSSTPICPSCSKELSNASRSLLLTSKASSSTPNADAAALVDNGEPSAKKSKKDKSSDVAACGHVVCGTCVDTIVKPSKQCVVCDAKVRPEKDIIDLAKEGVSSLQAGRKPYLTTFCFLNRDRIRGRWGSRK